MMCIKDFFSVVMSEVSINADTDIVSGESDEIKFLKPNSEVFHPIKDSS